MSKERRSWGEGGQRKGGAVEMLARHGWSQDVGLGEGQGHLCEFKASMGYIVRLTQDEEKNEEKNLQV